MQRDPGPRGARRALGRLLEAVLASRSEANAVFDILAVLQVRRAGARGRRPECGPRARAPWAGAWTWETVARRSLGFYWGSVLASQGPGPDGSVGSLAEAGWSHTRIKFGVPWGWSGGEGRPRFPAGHGVAVVSPQSEDQEEIQDAVRACSRLFGALLERGELFVGQLPPEEAVMAGERVWRHGASSLARLERNFVNTGRAPNT